MPDITHPYDVMSSKDGRTAWRRTHANNEQTFVWCERIGDGGVTAVVAADVYQPDLRPIAAECIALAPDEESAAEHARRWMADHGKGIAADGDGGGIVQKIWGWMRDLDANAGQPTLGQTKDN